MALISTVALATALQGETDSSMSSTVNKDYIKSIEVSIDVSESDQNMQGGMFIKNMLRNTRYYRNTFIFFFWKTNKQKQCTPKLL